MQSACIVVADDEFAIRSLVAAILRGEGYEVYAVADGQAALDAVLSLQPDLLLLDIAMPVLTGDLVMRQLRDDGVSFPVVIMTAGPIVSRWYYEGATAMLAKPFDLSELINLVASVLGLPDNETS